MIGDLLRELFKGEPAAKKTPQQDDSDEMDDDSLAQGRIRVITKAGDLLGARRSLIECEPGLQPVAFALRLDATTMKRIRITLVALLMCSAFASYAEDAKPSPSPADNPPSTSALKDDKDKVSYSLGVDIGRTLQKFQLDLNETGTLSRDCGRSGQ